VTNTVPSKPRMDLYRSITEKIVAAIEAGAGEFVMPWHRSGIRVGRPTNALSGARYRGINVVALWAESMLEGYDTGYWATYKQWQEVGGQVRKGERGASIVFYTELPLPDGGSLLPADDDPPQRFVIRGFRVFNAAQVEGWAEPNLPEIPEWQRHEAAEVFIGRTQAVILHGGEQAYYDRKADLIKVPDKERFVGSATSSPAEAYYSTMLHELVHWTGAVHRLDRRAGAFGTPEYAFEELVAELGAAFLCGELEMQNEPRPDHAAYIANWLRVLREDNRAIFRAARQAQTAVEKLAQNREE
jgi:antirestriction protein ArdC